MRKTNAKPVKRRVLCTFLALLLICAAIVADSCCRITVTEYTLEYENLPHSFDGLRIVQLSDLHGMSFGEKNSRLVRRVEGLEPDLILLTGDFIDSEDDIEVTKTLCAQLTELAPVYFASGNHDWGCGSIWELAEALEETGVRYLHNEYEELSLGEESIIIAGVEDPNSLAEMTRPDELAASIRLEHPEKFVMLLGHRNYWPETYPELPVDIIFSGHGHGGVVRLPFVGGVLGTDHNLFPEYDAGIFESGNYRMVVSRGLGGNGSLAVPRFLNNPEIVCAELKKSS